MPRSEAEGEPLWHALPNPHFQPPPPLYLRQL